jgi:hypothetical protein
VERHIIGTNLAFNCQRRLAAEPPSMAIMLKAANFATVCWVFSLYRRGCSARADPSQASNIVECPGERVLVPRASLIIGVVGLALLSALFAELVLETPPQRSSELCGHVLQRLVVAPHLEEILDLDLASSEK